MTSLKIEFPIRQKFGNRFPSVVLFCLCMALSLPFSSRAGQFGQNIVPNQKIQNSVMTGDFNGDGKEDTLCILTINIKFKPRKECKIADPWGDTPIRSKGEHMAIGIKNSGPAKRGISLFILHNASFFSTSIWDNSELPLTIVKKDSEKYKLWTAKVPGLKFDAVELGTEAGKTILLYWIGSKYALYQEP